MNAVTIPPNLLDIHVQPCAPEDFPGPVVRLLEDKRTRGIDAATTPLAWAQGFMFIDEDAITYGAHQLKLHPTGLQEEEVYVVDTDERRTLGYGYTRLMHNPINDALRDIAFVGFSYTRLGLRGQGLGTRRLLGLHAVTKDVLGYPLHSGQFPSAGQGPWDLLVAAGMAETVQVGDFKRARLTI